MISNPKISIIVAISENNVIGNKGKIPWHIPEDLKRFREITKGHVVIMGRKTYESIGRPLPDRVNIVITRDQNFHLGDTINRIIVSFVVHSLEEAITLAKIKEKDEIFIIGGGRIYEQAMKYADKLYLTIVKRKFEGDAFFPDYSEFKKVDYKKAIKDKNYEYTFLVLKR